jgi:hypothetical protein
MIVCHTMCIDCVEDLCIGCCVSCTVGCIKRAKTKEQKSKGKRPVTTEAVELGENLNVDVEDM